MDETILSFVMIGVFFAVMFFVGLAAHAGIYNRWDINFKPKNLKRYWSQYITALTIIPLIVGFLKSFKKK